MHTQGSAGLIGTVIKRTIQVFAALLLLAMFGYPLSAAWLERHPETEDVLDGAGANVDPEAGVFTRAGQFVTGISKSREALAEEAREKAEDKAFEEAERKESNLRKFNSGELAQEDN